MRRKVLRYITLGLTIILFAAFFVAVSSWAAYVLFGNWPRLVDAIGIGLIIVIGIIIYLRGE